MTAWAGGLAVCCAVMMFGTASSALAGVSLSVSPDIDDAVTVGTVVPTTLFFQNANTVGEIGDTDRVTSINLIPSCGEATIANAGTCLDPAEGVLVPVTGVAAGQGATGTDCDAFTFTIARADPLGNVGIYSFTPNGTLDLDQDETCMIEFQTRVLRVPTESEDSSVAAGRQTAQKATVAAIDIDDPGALEGGGSGTDQTTVLRAPIGLTTVVNPETMLLGGSFRDSAILAVPTLPGVAPPGGTVTFTVYKGDICTEANIAFGPDTVPVTGGTTLSPVYTPTTIGTYRVIVTYSGDANYLAAGPTACLDALEDVVVTNTPPVTPPPAVTPPPPPPVVTPPPPPPAAANEICTPPPGPAPAGGELCARGTAAIRGAGAGCKGTPFNVLVNGRQIERVIFSLDGKVVRTLTRPNSGSRFKLAVNPRALRTGTHRVLARTVFRQRSGTRSRTLRVTFSKCSRRAVSPSTPAFTG